MFFREMMPYREKIAWLSMLAMLLTFGPYFTLVASGYFPAKPMPDLHQLAGYAITATVQVTLLLIGHVVLRRRNPLDAKLPADERDIAIKQRSVTAAYYVLITGMILVGVVMPFSSNGWHIVNSALFMIVIAQMVQYAVMVIGYRRQAG
jgi:cytochrome b561